MATNRPKIVLYTGNDNCSAWYLDGHLQGEGEDATVLEQVFAELGVEHRLSNEFLMGTTGNRTMAGPTLKDVAEYVRKQDRREGDLRRASNLRVEANEKIAEAARLEALHQ